MAKIKTELPSITCELVERTLGRDSYRRLCMSTFLFTNPSPKRRVYWHSIPNSLRNKFSQEIQTDMGRQFFDAIQKGIYNPQKEKSSKAPQLKRVQDHLLKQSETFYKSHYPLFGLSRQYFSGMQELSRIFEVLRSEEAAHLGGLSISFENVETEIAKCIAGCLSDCPVQKRDTSRILSLVKDYKVVRPLQDGNPSVSLLTLYSILQDNFQGSYLCRLLNLFVAEHNGVKSKMVTF